MKYAVRGSCFTLSVSEKFPEHFSAASLSSHVRADCLSKALGILVEGTASPRALARKYFWSQKELTELVVPYSDPKRIVQAKMWMKWHRKVAIQTFVNSFADIDFFIMDTNYELNDALYYQSRQMPEKMLLRLRLNETVSKEMFREVPLGIDDAIVSLKHLVGNIRRYTKAPVILMNFPYSAFAAQNTEGARGRVERTKRIDAAFAGVADCHFIPACHIPQRFFTQKGNFYFLPEVYRAYANHIVHCLQTNTWPQIPIGTNVLDLPGQKQHGKTAPRQAEGQVCASPYSSLPERNFWRPAVAERFPLSVEQVYEKKFSLTHTDAIATCGSCFAQHIGRRLRANGFSLLDMEPAPPDMPEEQRLRRGYGIYSARFGNIYTARNLLQLFEQAFSDQQHFEYWEHEGRFFDPCRPALEPEGYASEQELFADRTTHLEKVRAMFQTLDVLIFTLGLTEAWRSRKSGLVYQICPGTTVGRFDPAEHEFVNFSYEEILADLASLWQQLLSLNPKARMILTVSPVPLTATAENRHVLVSTCLSKSVLRAVSGAMAAAHAAVDYFPSYELITSHNFRGMFYEPNLRSVRPEGVDFVMKQFFDEHGADVQENTSPDGNDELCDEILLEAYARITSLADEVAS